MTHTTNERDTRVAILNSFLTSPHRKLADLAPLHREALERDPLFYSRLALWYIETGEVRDHKILFVAHLITSDYDAFREAGWVLLQDLAPFEVARVLDHAKQVIGKAPRILKSAVTSYLRTRERSGERFDRAALRARKDLKHLYASLRIKPGARAQAILFAEQPPAGSQLAGLKQLARTSDGLEQARIILDNRIPYTTAIGAISQLTPALLVALIDAMSPQEVINNLGSLKRRGAMDNEQVKALIESKLAAAATDTRVSTLKTKQAIAHAGVDAETERALTAVTDTRVAAKVEIRRPTALFVDKSGSMTTAIQVARELASLVSAVVTADFRVYAFDTAAFEVTPVVKRGLFRRAAHSDWTEAFALIKANGGTSIGAPLAKLTRERIPVEQIVIVTDEGENTAPLFHDAYDEYVRVLGMRPNVVVVGVESSDGVFSQNLLARGIVVTRYEFKGDYYSLPNLLPLLALPSQAELVDSIMARELPRRPAMVA